MVLSGVTNGEPDANGIWHNSQYYSYTVSTQTLAAGSWGAAGTYFVLSPNADSQTQGYLADQRGHAAEQPVRGRPGHHVDLAGFRVHAALRRSRQRAVRIGRRRM